LRKPASTFFKDSEKNRFFHVDRMCTTGDRIRELRESKNITLGTDAEMIGRVAGRISRL
jgi:hypothetical protein